MDLLIVIHYLGIFLMCYGVAFLLPIIIVLLYNEFYLFSVFVYSSFTVVVVGGVFFGATYFWVKREDRKIQLRESLAIVGLGWFLVTAFGGLPYFFSGRLGVIDSIFESVSGFTTTGATVINDVEVIPKSLLFWRALTHFIGGVGIVVIFISVLPYLGVGGRLLLESESFAPDVKFIKPRIKETAKQILFVYLLLTVIQILLLLICGMNLFDAICHTFATLSTGGFSTKNKSIEAFNSLRIELVIIVFMLLGATNFGLMYRFIRGNLLEPLRNTEWKVFIFIWAISIVLITLCLMGYAPQDKFSKEEYPIYGLGKALRYSAFTVTSLFTSTGFTNIDYDEWHSFARWYLMVITIIGGCAGSTCGGIKTIRFIILGKFLLNRLISTFQPRTVRAVVIGKQVVSEEIQKAVQGFIGLWLLLLAIGSFVLCWFGTPIVTGVSAVIVSLANVGPGLEFVGGSENYAEMPQIAKVVLALLMLMGRIELYSILILFVPSFWLKK